MTAILCPICRLDLDRQAKTWRCEKGHSFDVAREGYVNLLPVQQKNSSDPGDTAESLRARREFLQAGHYQGLRDAVIDLLQPLGANNVLDVGCGEGYYTSVFTQVAGEVIGLDIAKPAIQLAARRYPALTWLVASGAQLPFADGAINMLSLMFTQLHMPAIERVLAAGAHVLVVTPAPDHLWTVREGLFEEVRAHEPDKFLSGFEASFSLQSRQEVRLPLDLTQQSLRHLLAMTPYVWKARPERRASLEAETSFMSTAAFTLLLFRKKAG